MLRLASCVVKACCTGLEKNPEWEEIDCEKSGTCVKIACESRASVCFALTDVRVIPVTSSDQSARGIFDF